MIVDDNQDRDFLAVIKKKFRELGSLHTPRLVMVGDVRFRGSAPDELIQLADMVCQVDLACRPLRWEASVKPRSARDPGLNCMAM